MDYHDVYQLLVDETDRVGWPLHFKNDLIVHDRTYLEKHHPKSFVWALRECGTHLFDTLWLEKEHTPECKNGVTSCWGECDGAMIWLRATHEVWPDALLYTWKYGDDRLTQVSYGDAMKFLRENQE